jgi:protein transport protein SEC24
VTTSTVPVTPTAAQSPHFSAVAAAVARVPDVAQPLMTPPQQPYPQPQHQPPYAVPQAQHTPLEPMPVPRKKTPQKTRSRSSPGKPSSSRNTSGSRSRIDPTQIPRPDLSLLPWAEFAARAEHPPTTTMSYIVPPSSLDVQASQILDDGCAAPQFVRSTMYGVPANPELMKRFVVPLTVHVTPLAPASGAPVPEVDPARCLGGSGQDGSSLRCERCRAYINPHVEWIESGAAYNCALCGQRNSLPRGAVCPLDEYGRRRDHGAYPEVAYGSVDYSAPAAMQPRSTEPPAFIFAVDVSYSAIACGLLHAAVHCIRSLIDRVQGQPGVRIGLVACVALRRPSPESRARCLLAPCVCVRALENSNARPRTLSRSRSSCRRRYSTDLQFFDLSRSGGVGLLCVPDMGDPFVPLPFKSWVVDPSAQRDELLAMLETLQALHVELDVKRSYAAVGSVVKAVVDAVKAEGISARLLVLSSTLTTGGRGGLRTREAAGHYGKAQEQEMLRPTPDDSACVLPPPPRAIQRLPLFLRSFSAPRARLFASLTAACLPCGRSRHRSFTFYDALAAEAGEAGIGIDMCLCAKSYADAATLALLPQRTGGALRYWRDFSGARSADVRGLQAFIEHAVLKTGGWDGVLKVRCSKGLHVTQYRAHCFDPTKPEIAIACLDSESTISVELAQTGTFDLGGCVCIQAALLYTRGDGKRMIRVHTLRLEVCDTVTNLFKHADLHACAVAFAKSACAMVRDAGASCINLSVFLSIFLLPFFLSSFSFSTRFVLKSTLGCTHNLLSPPVLPPRRRHHDYGGPPPAEYEDHRRPVRLLCPHALSFLSSRVSPSARHLLRAHASSSLRLPATGTRTDQRARARLTERSSSYQTRSSCSRCTSLACSSTPRSASTSASTSTAPPAPAARAQAHSTHSPPPTLPLRFRARRTAPTRGAAR